MLEYFALYPENLEQIEDLNMEERGRIFTAIMEYAFSGKEPEFETGTMCRLAWRFLKPRIDAAIKKSDTLTENGRRGGRPKNQTETNAKPNENQSKTKAKPNANQTQTNDEPTQNQTQTKPKAKKSPESESETESESISDMRSLRAHARARETEAVADKVCSGIPWAMTGNDREELHQLIADLMDAGTEADAIAVIDYAAEEAKKHGGRSCAYFLRVLISLIDDGIRTAADVQRTKGKGLLPAQQYAQRDYSGVDEMFRQRYMEEMTERIAAGGVSA